MVLDASVPALEPSLNASTAAAAVLAGSNLAASSATTTTYSGGVTVTPTQVITEGDTIPRFVADPTITNIRSGSWSDPTIWSLGRVPINGDKVQIAPQTTVTYSTVSSASINGIEVDGSLIFSTTVNTQLIVGNLMVMPTGTLQIGTASQPVSPNVSASL